MMQHGRRGTQLFVSFLLIALCVFLISCETLVTIEEPPSPTQTASQDGEQQTIGAQEGVKLFVQPEDGEEVILDAINGAKSSVWVKVYLLTNRKVMDALMTVAKRGLDVRLLLEDHPFGGGGGLSPKEVMKLVTDGGVKGKFTNPKFRFTHEKSMLIDGNAAYIMTLNLTKSALGDRNREYGIIATNPADVKAIKAIYEADWDYKDVTIDNPNIVASPINARSTFVSLLQQAKKTLLLEAETLDDPEVEKELAAAVKRGVDVRIVVPATLAEDDVTNANALVSQGVKIRQIKSPYMHAKIIVVDGKLAFIGSVNISTNSMNNNRELGILVANQTVLDTLATTFEKDWTKAKTNL